jgi:hypothetical protein
MGRPSLPIDKASLPAGRASLSIDKASFLVGPASFLIPTGTVSFFLEPFVEEGAAIDLIEAAST